MKPTLLWVARASVVAAIILLSIAAGSYVHTASANNKVTPAPVGVTKYLVFMANGAVEPASLLLNGDAFQRDIMKRSPREIAAFKTLAKQYFLDQYGLDFFHAQTVNGNDMIDGAVLNTFMANPAVGYRAYTVSGENVPSEGWEVRDGGYMVTFTKDTLLHGAYGGIQGKVTAAGTIIFYGEYNIVVPGGNPIVIQYEDPMPMMIDMQMGMSIDCDLHSKEWGDGKAMGLMGMAMPQSDGKVMVPVRNILTFEGQ
jgi:hypothetical protein